MQYLKENDIRLPLYRIFDRHTDQIYLFAWDERSCT
jgi:hypothetical protein